MLAVRSSRDLASILLVLLATAIVVSLPSPEGQSGSRHTCLPTPRQDGVSLTSDSPCTRQRRRDGDTSFGGEAHASAPPGRRTMFTSRVTSVLALVAASLLRPRTNAAQSPRLVTVKAHDFRFEAPTSVPAGTITFRMENDGKDSTTSGS